VTRSLLVLADRLGELGVTRVVMEATSDYWKSPFYLLEAQGFEVWLVNAREVQAPTGSTQDRPAGSRSGCVRSPSGSCCAPASCRHLRSGGCGT
jgi:hypothetical protein